jgi:hypothetical protein
MNLDDNDVRPDAMIAGTLCLMSCYTQHPVAAYAGKVAHNLTRMAALAELSPELRTICARLSRQWEGLHAEARSRASCPNRDDRSLH